MLPVSTCRPTRHAPSCSSRSRSSSTASAQDSAVYSVYASQAALDDGGTLAGALPTCLAVNGPFESRQGFLPGPVYFFDRASGRLASHDADAAPGARTVVRATAAALAAAAGAPVTDCLDAAGAILDEYTGSDRRVVFLAVATSAGTEVVLRLDPDGTLARLTDPTSMSDDGRGVTGLVYGVRRAPGQADVPEVSLARSRERGAPESGLYCISPEALDQTPTAVALAPSVEPAGIGFFDTFGGVRLVSSSGSDPDRRNTVLGAGLVVFERPCGEAGCDGRLTDIATGSLGGDNGTRYSLVYEDGLASGGRVLALDRVSVDVVLTAAGLVAATGIAGFAPAGRGGYLALLPGRLGRAETLLVAGSGAGGAAPGIYGAADAARRLGRGAPTAECAPRRVPQPGRRARLGAGLARRGVAQRLGDGGQRARPPRRGSARRAARAPARTRSSSTPRRSRPASTSSAPAPRRAPSPSSGSPRRACVLAGGERCANGTTAPARALGRSTFSDAMRRALPLTLLLLATVSASAPASSQALPAAARAYLGDWTVVDENTDESTAVVRITQAGAGVEGRIVRVLADAPSIRARSSSAPCARATTSGVDLRTVRLIHDMRWDGERFTGGRIVDPQNDKTYRASLTLDGANRLRVRGYIGIPTFGRSQTWTRVR